MMMSYIRKNSTGLISENKYKGKEKIGAFKIKAKKKIYSRIVNVKNINLILLFYFTSDKKCRKGNL